MNSNIIQANLPSDNQTVHDYTTPELTKSITSLNQSNQDPARQLVLELP